jgi:hypothetical protein
MNKKTLLEIFISIATLTMLIISIIATNNMSQSNVTAKQKNEDMEKLTLGVFIPGFLFTVAIFVGVAMSIYFGDMQILTDSNFRNLIIIMSIVSIIILIIGSYMISLKDNKEIDDETKNSKYTLVAVFTTTIAVSLLVCIIFYIIMTQKIKRGVNPDFLEEVNSF